MATAFSSLRHVTLSLTGSGHLLIYQLGACQRLLSHEQVAVDHVVGASGGAIASAVVAAQLSLEDYAQAFIRERGRGMHLLREFWDKKKSSTSPLDTTTSQSIVGLHIATTRCQDGTSKVFSFQDFNDRERIFECIRASCLIPPTFHPLDIVSSPSPYPDHEGIPIDDPVVGMEFYVDGGIATPAPIIDSAGTDNQSSRIIISPVAGTSKYTPRISPRVRGWWWPQIQVRHDMGLRLSWANLKALRAAAGSVTSAELQEWYDRGQEDADHFLNSFVETECIARI